VLSCDAISRMKLVIGIAALALIALSFYADFRWKRWIASRKEERDPQK
jgi:hypothetical protein